MVTWASLVTLFVHQLEEYRVPGTFPGMLNTAMFNSRLPDRYPLNSNTSFYVNVVIGWTCYLLAALFAEKAIWLGIATITVSIGNTIAHTTIFNIKAKTFYNAGLFTSWLLFRSLLLCFFIILYNEHLATPIDFCIGIRLGIVINIVGILKLIDWMADKNTIYIFDETSLLPKGRHKRTC